MNQITFPRTSYDGIIVEKSEIEEWFLYGASKTLKGKKNYNLVDEIGKRLKTISSANNEVEKRLLDFVSMNLDFILVCSPEVHRKWIGKKRFNISGNDKFLKDLLQAFNYDFYRDNKLRDLACFLDVKSCPYCNMSYTLFAEDGKDYKKMASIFQFDHFYGEKKYPFLSMSLYNLIPSCAICNQKKSDNPLSLNFHPYFNGINKHFYFKVNDTLSLLLGAKKDKVNVGIELENNTITTQGELYYYDSMFDISLRYSRHKDIVQEVFDKAYLETYYGDSSFFNFLDDRFKKEYLYRLIYGVYMDENEIEKRPMSKFVQDIRRQAIDKIYYDYSNGWCF